MPSNTALVENSPLIKQRKTKFGDTSSVIPDIYQGSVNMVVWKRDYAQSTLQAVESYINQNPRLRLAMTVSPIEVSKVLQKELGERCPAELIADITELLGMFCYLFDLKRAGLRLTALDKAMCPSFHVDKVPCRLVTTYSGQATQWLNHQDTQRDSEDKVLKTAYNADLINQLQAGDVALLKGESWFENEGAGLVHRSPSLELGELRLLLTLDFVN